MKVRKIIGLINVDSRLPNYALMKIKQFYGNEAEFVKPTGIYEKIYASCIFTKNKN